MVPKRKRPEDLPPAFFGCILISETKKPGVGFLSTLGFGSSGFFSAIHGSSLFPGRRPKIKAAPKGKVKKREIAAGNHETYIRRYGYPVSRKIFFAYESS